MRLALDMLHLHAPGHCNTCVLVTQWVGVQASLLQYS
jgi:hypothetical protein